MQDISDIKRFIDKQWENIDKLTDHGLSALQTMEVVKKTFRLLNSGEIRVAEKENGKWITNTWIKKAILMYFKLMPDQLFENGPSTDGTNHNKSVWYDRVISKFAGWSKEEFKKHKIRAVPGSIVRYSAFIGENSVLMPSFINIGAYIDSGTMVDTWATIGSCAQIGKNCHISGGTGIGGVLEPLNATPVIIEDNCFIGARSEVAEGVIIEEGSVISMGVFIGASTKIVNRKTGEISYGRVPKYSVVVPGSIPSSNNTNLYAVIIVKTVDEQTRKKVAINDLLRS